MHYKITVIAALTALSGAAACKTTGTGTVADSSTASVPVEKTSRDGKYGQPVSDEELRLYNRITQKTQRIVVKFQQEMDSVIQQTGLNTDRFHAIARAGEQGRDAGMTPEEQKKYKATAAEIEKLQEENLKEQEKLITESGMTVDRYNEISIRLFQNQGLFRRYKSIREQ